MLTDSLSLNLFCSSSPGLCSFCFLPLIKNKWNYWVYFNFNLALTKLNEVGQALLYYVTISVLESVECLLITSNRVKRQFFKRPSYYSNLSLKRGLLALVHLKMVRHFTGTFLRVN